MTTNAALLCSIVIPVFNKWELTKNCLESLKEHTPEGICEVIVVDNASSDDTAAHLQPLGEQLFGTAFSRIRFEENRNFAPACNAGAKAAKADMVFFLNNDTLLTPHWFGPLYECFTQTPQLGAAGPLLLYENNTVQHLGVTFAPGGISHLYQHFPENHAVVAKKRRLQVITAAALMMPKELFWACGGFYEEYRNGFEDIELCLRLRERGKTLACVAQSRIYHLESQTPGRKTHDDYNANIFFNRCRSGFVLDQHQHALRDGFSVVLNDLLDTSILVSPEESKQLLMQSIRMNAAELFELTKQHPYWQAGLIRIATLLEDAQEWLLAATSWAQAANTHLTAGIVERMKTCGEKAEAEPLVAEADHLLRRIAAIQENPEHKALVCKKHIAAAIRQNDKFLEQLYRSALP